MSQAVLAPSTPAPSSSTFLRTLRDAELREFLSATIGDQIHLVAIGRKGWIVARDFGRDAGKAAAWARRQNDRESNIYFSVNRVIAGLDAKARKCDVEAIRFAHVDIDPPKDGSPFDRAGMEARLRTAPVPPTLVIASGNGLQAFWRVSGASIEEIEAVNRGLIAAFEGDKGIWNADRIMRVPGTTNWPDARHAAAGRVPAEARVLRRGDHRTVAIDALLASYPDRKGPRT